MCTYAASCAFWSEGFGLIVCGHSSTHALSLEAIELLVYAVLTVPTFTRASDQCTKALLCIGNRLQGAQS